MKSLLLDFVPLGCKFLDIFPIDLLGIPPLHKIEFAINLEQPISMSPYRMAHAKLKKMNSHLYDLFSNSFIRLSVSPWRDPILFVKKKDSSTHICINYMKHTKVTVKNCYHMPRIYDLFN